MEKCYFRCTSHNLNGFRFRLLEMKASFPFSVLCHPSPEAMSLAGFCSKRLERKKGPRSWYKLSSVEMNEVWAAQVKHGNCSQQHYIVYWNLLTQYSLHVLMHTHKVINMWGDRCVTNSMWENPFIMYTCIKSPWHRLYLPILLIIFR